MKTRNVSTKILIVALSVILMCYTVSLFIPILWGLMTTFKTQADFRLSAFGLPNPFTLENYGSAFERLYLDVKDRSDVLVRVDFGLMYMYSTVYAGGCALIQTLTVCIVAYATAKFHYFKLSKVVYTIVLVTMALPIIGNLPSEIQMSKNLGLYNSFIGIFIMKMSFLGMYYLVFYSSFKGVAKDFYEAAYLDGANEFTVMVCIGLPLVRYTFFTVLLLNLIGFWNDYQVPLIYLPSYPTVAYGVFSFSNSNDARLSSVPIRLTGCIMMLVPVLVLFVAFNKQLMGNVSMGGIKE